VELDSDRSLSEENKALTYDILAYLNRDCHMAYRKITFQCALLAAIVTTGLIFTDASPLAWIIGLIVALCFFFSWVAMVCRDYERVKVLREREAAAIARAIPRFEVF
jgi:uncharacterized membrane protein